MTTTAKTPVSRATATAPARFPTGSGSAVKPERALSSARSSAAPAASAEQRWAMICEAAYYIAERRAFEAGHELDDWLLAEKQIDATLATG
jgi:Protein of unknown function (DUF2934)